MNKLQTNDYQQRPTTSDRIQNWFLSEPSTPAPDNSSGEAWHPACTFGAVRVNMSSGVLFCLLLFLLVFSLLFLCLWELQGMQGKLVVFSDSCYSCSCYRCGCSFCMVIVFLFVAGGGGAPPAWRTPVSLWRKTHILPSGHSPVGLSFPCIV